MISSTLKFSLFGTALLVGDCSLAPEYVRPASPVPGNFPSGSAYSQAPVVTDAPAVADLTWQQFFTDEKLQQVITLALADNRDLRIAALHVERARALYGIQRAELLPAVNAAGTMTRQHLPADLSGRGHGTTTNQYSVDFGFASWELDFFGRIRSLSDTALEQFFATEEARRATQILLVSQVSHAYLTLAADKANLKLAQNTLAAQRDSYDLVQRRVDRGLSPELDRYRVQTQVDTARRAVAEHTQWVAQDVNALNLLGSSQVPDELLLADLDHVNPPHDIDTAVSSDVLLDQPDILQAEHQLKSANANIGRSFRTLTVINEFTRECLAIDVPRKLNSEDVLERLSWLMLTRGVPRHIRSDNGSEFTANAVQDWLKRVGGAPCTSHPAVRGRTGMWNHSTASWPTNCWNVMYSIRCMKRRC